MGTELIAIPCLSDNYAWLLHDPAIDCTLLVDAPEAAPILAALHARDWHLTHILLTHHHADHTDGAAVLAAATGARMIGALADLHRLPPGTEPVSPGATIPLGLAHAEVIDAPGHTLGHVAYYLPETGVLFSGDSLMSWGCGRLFEGTPAQMWDTLSRLSALPPETTVCSGHEYTESNGRFALSLTPDAPALLARMEAVRTARSEGRPTLPVALALELETNPFLRADTPELRAATGLADAPAAAVFAEIRARKDRF